VQTVATVSEQQRAPQQTAAEQLQQPEHTAPADAAIGDDNDDDHDIQDEATQQRTPFASKRSTVEQLPTAVHDAVHVQRSSSHKKNNNNNADDADVDDLDERCIICLGSFAAVTEEEVMQEAQNDAALETKQQQVQRSRADLQLTGSQREAKQRFAAATAASAATTEAAATSERKNPTTTATPPPTTTTTTTAQAASSTPSSAAAPTAATAAAVAACALDTYGDAPRLVRLPCPCSAYYHLSCLKESLRHKGQCPMCRYCF
jgi:hypothetical protein